LCGLRWAASGHAPCFANHLAAGMEIDTAIHIPMLHAVAGAVKSFLSDPPARFPHPKSSGIAISIPINECRNWQVPNINLKAEPSHVRIATGDGTAEIQSFQSFRNGIVVA